MNLSLLSKWRWKLLMGGDEVWKRVVVAKYGVGVVGNLNLDVETLRHDTSTWWRNICSLFLLLLLCFFLVFLVFWFCCRYCSRLVAAVFVVLLLVCAFCSQFVLVFISVCCR
jgi:hypothetical protein